MKNSFLFIKCFILLFLITIFSCKKRDVGHLSNVDSKDSSTKFTGKSPSRVAISGGSCVEDTSNPTAYDSVLVPTVLGYHLVNHPYSLAHMQQAYTNLYGSASGVNVTNKYVRFKPSSPDQLSVLEDLDIDLFDHPLDYDVVQEGDYYDDGITPAEEIPWLYAVVTSGFTPPAGITYEELEQIHVPTLAAVENEALRITGNPIDDNSCGDNAARKVQPNVLPCDEGYHWDYTLHRCVPNNCPTGYHWDPSSYSCVRDVVTPPPPSPLRQPSGTINVEDNVFHSLRGVRVARVVAKRFLKIERSYTNNQGQFFITKEFNKVHLSVKFKNDQAKIRALRRARLWQMLFPVEVNLGKHKGSSLNNLTFNILYEQNALRGGARDWAAASAHNMVQEYYDFATQQNIGTPPNKLRILLTNWGRVQGSGGASPMFAKRFWQTLPAEFVTTFIISDLNLVAGGVTALTFVLKSEVDVTVGYNPGNNVTENSDGLSETMFHELTHAAHYNKVSNSWWQTFVDAELNAMVHGPSPYGNGTTINASYIGLGESWAYHMGHFMADLKYGINSGSTFEQGITYGNGPIFEGGFQVANTGLNAHLNLLEDFDPGRTNDDFRWIPQGLYYDLIDNRNDQAFGRVNLNDVVSGYTNQQFFNALDNDITTLPDYRVRLLNENGNNQAAGVITIFNFYGY